eukprot:1157853-Pelagomonas_calceolata.AAC.2
MMCSVHHNSTSTHGRPHFCALGRAFGSLWSLWLLEAALLVHQIREHLVDQEKNGQNGRPSTHAVCNPTSHCMMPRTYSCGSTSQNSMLASETSVLTPCIPAGVLCTNLLRACRIIRQLRCLKHTWCHFVACKLEVWSGDTLYSKGECSAPVHPCKFKVRSGDTAFTLDQAGSRGGKLTWCH